MSSVKAWEGRRACPAEHSGRELQVRRGMLLVRAAPGTTPLCTAALWEMCLSQPLRVDLWWWCLTCRKQMPVLGARILWN